MNSNFLVYLKRSVVWLLLNKFVILFVNHFFFVVSWTDEFNWSRKLLLQSIVITVKRRDMFAVAVFQSNTWLWFLLIWLCGVFPLFHDQIPLAFRANQGMYSYASIHRYCLSSNIGIFGKVLEILKIKGNI